MLIIYKGGKSNKNKKKTTINVDQQVQIEIMKGQRRGRHDTV